MRRSLVAFKRAPRPTARIVCFPYAGGHAAFVHAWPAHLPAHLDLLGVQYPGTDALARGHTSRSVQAIADTVLEELLQYADVPLILFGYSLGALIAYEVSLRLASHRIRTPAELIVAATKPPHIPRTQAPMAGLPEPEFIAKLRSLGGTPEEVLENAELRSLFLPMLRRDFATAESYVPSPAAPLRCPITAIGGTTDGFVDSTTLAAWQACTQGSFRIHTLAGGHFFIQQQLHATITIVRDAVERHVRPPAS